MPRLTFVCLIAMLAAGCQGGGDFNILGYSTRPQYDESIKTVYVPQMKNLAFQTTPNRDLEVDITRAVIREIEAKTRMKVVSDRERADTELTGTLVSIQKVILNTTQQNMTREAEIRVTVNVVWRDLRTGQVLSNRRPANVPDAAIPFDPSLPPVDAIPLPVKAVPAQIIVAGRVLPELGESNATAGQSVANQVAKQIVHMMEAPW